MLKHNRLSFSRNGNAKLKKKKGQRTATFSLPAGFTCPAAFQCQTFANRETGKITGGANAIIRCYAATAENLFLSIRRSRWHNFEMLRACKSVTEMADLIDKSLPRKEVKLCRIHASGDFYSQDYFDAWVEVAKRNPHILFYGYTKALPFWIARLGHLPDNFKLVASYGGRYDNLVRPYKLRFAVVVFSELQAEKFWRLPIDHDDSHAYTGTGNFCILLHNTQPAGTGAAKAWHKIKTQGRGGYKSDYFAHYAK